MRQNLESLCTRPATDAQAEEWHGGGKILQVSWRYLGCIPGCGQRSSFLYYVPDEQFCSSPCKMYDGKEFTEGMSVAPFAICVPHNRIRYPSQRRHSPTRTGEACAIFPMSSSACINFFTRAAKGCVDFLGFMLSVCKP